MMKRADVRAVCVFCGSARGTNLEYAAVARQLGRELATRNLDLVYGAGDVGLMGIVADAALEAGVRVIGVIPRALVDREVAHKGLTECHIVETMHQRKALMADKADAFVALPGGFGTLDELFEILTWAQLGIHAKPIGLLNVREYFTPLLTWLDQAVDEGFLRQKHRDLLLVRNEVKELLNGVLTRSPAPPVEKWASDAER
jgi:hypothetical protein